MGIYATNKRVDDVKVGNKGIVSILQNNKIIYLGPNFWAINMGNLTYSYDSSNRRFYCAIPAIKTYANGRTNPDIYIANYECLHNEEPFDINWDMKVYNSAGDVEILYFHNHEYDDPADFKASMNNVWLVYGYNRTLYAKLDLGSVTWEKYAAYKAFRTDAIDNLKAPANDDTNAKISVLSLETSNVTNGIGNMIDNIVAVSTSSRIYIRKTNAYYDTFGPSKFTQDMKSKTILYEVAE